MKLTDLGNILRFVLEEGCEEDELDEEGYEDEKEEQFDEWLDDYTDSLEVHELVQFIEKYIHPDEYHDFYGKYSVDIPAEIYRMAED